MGFALRMPQRCQIVYASDALTSVETTLLDIVRAAERRNRAAGVSGMLHFGQRGYVQLLEGPKAAVREIYDSIAADSRHAIRWCVSWNIDEPTIGPDLPMGYCTSRDCDWFVGLEKPDARRAAAKLTELSRQLYPEASRVSEPLSAVSP